MEYKILEEEESYDLENEATNHIEKGWKLQGGIFVLRAKNSEDEEVLRYYQAIFKE